MDLVFLLSSMIFFSTHLDDTHCTLRLHSKNIACIFYLIIYKYKCLTFLLPFPVTFFRFPFLPSFLISSLSAFPSSFITPCLTQLTSRSIRKAQQGQCLTRADVAEHSWEKEISVGLSRVIPICHRNLEWDIELHQGREVFGGDWNEMLEPFQNE